MVLIRICVSITILLLFACSQPKSNSLSIEDVQDSRRAEAASARSNNKETINQEENSLQEDDSIPVVFDKNEKVGEFSNPEAQALTYLYALSTLHDKDQSKFDKQLLSNTSTELNLSFKIHNITDPKNKIDVTKNYSDFPWSSFDEYIKSNRVPKVVNIDYLSDEENNISKSKSKVEGYSKAIIDVCMTSDENIKDISEEMNIVKLRLYLVQHNGSWIVASTESLGSYDGVVCAEETKKQEGKSFGTSIRSSIYSLIYGTNIGSRGPVVDENGKQVVVEKGKNPNDKLGENDNCEWELVVENDFVEPVFYNPKTGGYYHIQGLEISESGAFKGKIGRQLKNLIDTSRRANVQDGRWWKKYCKSNTNILPLDQLADFKKTIDKKIDNYVLVEDLVAEGDLPRRIDLEVTKAIKKVSPGPPVPFTFPKLDKSNPVLVNYPLVLSLSETYPETITTEVNVGQFQSPVTLKLIKTKWVSGEPGTSSLTCPGKGVAYMKGTDRNSYQCSIKYKTLSPDDGFKLTSRSYYEVKLDKYPDMDFPFFEETAVVTVHTSERQALASEPNK